ncbi:MAG: hypothetical protein Q4G24_10740 [Paracoccus sp. (in: a-proteobacteria)]|uniref:hypothetical protein n=1 Tax=Paracoccus sp. TaxID=267 RepID=UPI0026E0AE19|nr:hypothetical protein [Paracoccus sp. (in: a-proteobacteria)]MDO5621935.1 hypothetical protein [Paracoccus sp. (in: a-proteobacteria)]
MMPQPAPFDDSQVDPAACRALWQAVLCNAYVTATSSVQHHTSHTALYEIAHAQAWFGSPGFYEVCDLAGVDPVKALRSWRRMRRVGPRPRGATVAAWLDQVAA